jgi:isoleucyl-tRNA synthetase
MIRTDVGSDANLPQLCGRCAKLVETEYPAALTDGLTD